MHSMSQLDLYDKQTLSSIPLAAKNINKYKKINVTFTILTFGMFKYIMAT